MEIIENKENLKSILTVKISKEDYQPIVDKELKKARQTASIKGFRPGTAPMSLIKKMYEPSILLNEVNKLLTDSLDNFSKEDKRKRIGQIIPAEENQGITPQENKDFEFIFETAFYPELEYQLNEETELPFYDIVVEPQHIEERISNLRKQFSEIVDPENAGENDIIYASYFDLSNENQESDSENPESDSENPESDSENPESDGDNQDEDTDTEERFINFMVSVIPDEYKSLFIGAKTHDTIEVELRKVFPNQTDLLAMLRMTAEELEKLPETISLTVNRITRYELAELNQDFFDRIAEKDTIHSEDELKNHLTESSRTEYDNSATDKLVDDFKTYTEKTLNVETSEDFLVKYFRFMDENDTENEKIDRNIPDLINRLQWNYIIETLLQREDIQITEEEILHEAENEVINRLSAYNILNKETFDNFMKYTLDRKENIERIVYQLKCTKLGDLLKQKIKLDHKEISLAEFDRLRNEDFKLKNPESHTAEITVAETETAPEVEINE